MSVVTRFAPSPTGALHIGGVRTAIFNWLFARHAGGSFVLRIEDTDRERSTEESLEEILDSMRWLGLDWDGEPVRQSTRLPLYTQEVDKLVAAHKAYRCYLTPQELAAKREEARSAGVVFRYRREWAEETRTEGKPYAIRLITPDRGIIPVQDAIRGVITFEAKDIDDFIIMRADGTPIYNLAVVVDDEDMGVTHVIRGDDHLSNTPKHVLIYEALGYRLPRFAHVSMILGQDKTKLSKRHGATSVRAYRDLGYLPEALINYLARLGWSHGDQEVFTRAELIEKFTLETLGKSPAIFNPEKLEWLNAWYIRNKPLGEIVDLVAPLMAERGYDTSRTEWLEGVVSSVRERARTLVEIVDSVGYFFADIVEFEEKARKKFLVQESAPILARLIEGLGALDSFELESIKGVVEGITEDLGLKMVKVAQPARVALTGGTVSPGIFEVMGLLGKETVLARLERALVECGGPPA